MCRRTGSIGCSLNQAWAVGTMGLLDTPNGGVDANAAVPDAARSLTHAVAVAVAAVVVTSLTARCSPLVERCSLSVVHSPLSVEHGPSFAPTQGAARRSSGYPTTGRCAAASGAAGCHRVQRARSAPSACWTAPREPMPAPRLSEPLRCACLSRIHSSLSGDIPRVPWAGR